MKGEINNYLIVCDTRIVPVAEIDHYNDQERLLWQYLLFSFLYFIVPKLFIW
jgi:hypothetical protein